MAKKKKKRTVTRGAPAATIGPAIKPTPASPGGPNRQARKEEARRQREAIRRRMARRRIYRIVAIVTVLVLVAGAVTAYLLLRETPAEAAGCGGVRTIGAYSGTGQGGASLDRAHIGPGGDVAQPPALSTYPTSPPTSGPHDPSPLPAGVYDSPPPIYRAMHSLEHGAVIVWYRPGAQSSDLVEIQRFFRIATNNDHVIVAPYQYEGTEFPAGKQLVLVAWHHLQSCDRPSLDVVNSFVSGYRTRTGSSPPAYRGDAPEAGSPI